ncbi:MAG: CRISPR-associated protein Cas5 [Cetobacterium sp.]|uniref:CRISPR-associated protein Cas5 n=1 Tax=Cetobacterium sp. TaxID=2071632 RepID=UPI002FC60EA2
MNALRIILTQNEAHYRKEESQTNKMTYPLPPFSTIIGAIHKACNFKTYHPMNISVQGKYGSLTKQPFTNHCFLNSVMDDRGILVKVANEEQLSSRYEKVAATKKSQGNSFLKGITLDVFDEDLLNEYRALKILGSEIGDFKKLRLDKIKNLFKKRKKTIGDKKKLFSKNSNEYIHLENREKEIKNLEVLIDDKFKTFRENNYEKKVSRYQGLVTSLGYYEVLNYVKLVIHVSSDDETLKIIKDNIYNLKALGRSEDFVYVEEIEEVSLSNEIDRELTSEYSSYINIDLLNNESVFIHKTAKSKVAGTRYYINKDYNIIDNKRIFNKKKVLYISKFNVDEDSSGIYLDKEYIVTFN